MQLKPYINPVLLFLLVPVFVHGVFVFDVSDDEWIPGLELSEGAIDSVSFHELSRFYYHPISVPFGELRYLCDIFPTLADTLPLSASELEKYEPWTEEKVTEFFEDYPFLIPLKPLLSFEINSYFSFAHLGFSANVSPLYDRLQQTLSFILTPYEGVRAEGKIILARESIGWRRRGIRFTIPNLGSLYCGNFSQVLNKGLFYGYFPPHSHIQSSKRPEWLYGKSRTWNGFSGNGKIGKRSTVNLFFHLGTTETIAGFKTQIKPSAHFSIYGAFSEAKVTIDSNKVKQSYAVHWGLTLKKKKFSANLESGVDVFNIRGVPIHSTIKYGSTENRYSLSMQLIPESFTAPRSRLIRTMRSLLEINDSTRNTILAMTLSSHNTFNRYLKQVFSLMAVVMETNEFAKATYTVTGSYPFQYSLLYTWSSLLPVENPNYTIRLKGRYDWIQSLSLSPTFSVKWTAHELIRIISHIQIRWEPVSALSFSPFLTYIFSKKYQEGLLAGIQQTLLFYKKTEGKIKFVVPLGPQQSGKPNFSLHGTLHFLL